jgi:hypothetical protein
VISSEFDAESASLRSHAVTFSLLPQPRSTALPSAVRIGGKSKVELLRALREREVALNSAAEALFRDSRFATLSHLQALQIAVVSVAELGFADGATYEQLVERAVAVGWRECPLETGPHLRLQFLNQPEEAAEAAPARGAAPPGSVTVASPPLDDGDGTVKGFYLRRVDGVSWLRGYRAQRVHVWSPRDVLVWRVSG